MRRIHTKMILVPLAAAAVLLSACSGGGSGAATSPAASASGEKDTLTLGMTADIQGWDPGIQPKYQGWPGEAVWDRLVECDANGKLTASLADKFEVTNGNKTFTAHIREGQKFSDGTPVDSKAAKASFEYMARTGQATADFKGIKVETPDAQTVSVTWPDAQPVMANKVCNVEISTEALLTSGKVNDVPIGSGPYIMDVAKTTRGSVYTFHKNEANWNAANYPYKNLVVKVIESDTAALSALKTQQVDASLVATTAVNEAEASGLKVIPFQGQTTRLIISDRTGKVEPALGNLKVRQAMNMVFDKEAMVKNLYLGKAEATAQTFRKGTDAYIENLQDPYPFDVEKAKSLMAEAGYPNGFKLSIPTMKGQNHETLLPYVKQQLGLLNIEVKEVPLSGANAIADLLSGKFPVVMWQLGNLGNSALQIYIEDTPDGWWDLQHVKNDYVDSRWTKIKTADEATSKSLQQEINQYIVDQAWFAPMVYMGTFYAYNADKVSIPTQSDQEALTPKLRDFK